MAVTTFEKWWVAIGYQMKCRGSVSEVARAAFEYARMISRTETTPPEPAPNKKYDESPAWNALDKILSIKKKGSYFPYDEVVSIIEDALKSDPREPEPWILFIDTSHPGRVVEIWGYIKDGKTTYTGTRIKCT